MLEKFKFPHRRSVLVRSMQSERCLELEGLKMVSPSNVAGRSIIFNGRPHNLGPIYICVCVCVCVCVYLTWVAIYQNNNASNTDTHIFLSLSETSKNKVWVPFYGWSVQVLTCYRIGDSGTTSWQRRFIILQSLSADTSRFQLSLYSNFQDSHKKCEIGRLYRPKKLY
jgi:hypothetical protein